MMDAVVLAAVTETMAVVPEPQNGSKIVLALGANREIKHFTNSGE